jgi:cyclic pyranopterin phosphate synthase
MKDAPKRLDLRLNGKCNLQCIMCDVWQQPNGIYTEENFWKYGRESIFPYLKEIIVLGGEPFVQKDTFRLIDEISAVNKTCRWGFVTNGQYEVNEKILSALNKITLRSLKISLDSINPETYEKIRIGGQLQKSLSTLQKFIALKNERAAKGERVFVGISMSVQKTNYKELGNFIKFAKMLDLEFSLPFVAVPETHSILTLPEKQRKLALETMIGLRSEFNASQLDGIISPLEESLA